MSHGLREVDDFGSTGLNRNEGVVASPVQLTHMNIHAITVSACVQRSKQPFKDLRSKEAETVNISALMKRN